MYGYVVPYKPELKMQDFVLYRSFYCGLCKLTGSAYGQLPRFTTNFDMTFLAVLLHDFSSQSVEFYEKGCVLNPFKKKLTVAANPLMEKIGAANIITAYYKAEDGVRDREGASKRIARRMLKNPYKKASSAYPEIDSAVKLRYEALFRLESENASGIDRVSHCFAQLLSDVASLLIGDKADEEKLRLCYNVGKFVYIIDALDDVDEDGKKKRYNPFIAEYGFDRAEGREKFFENNKADLEFAVSCVLNRAAESFNRIRFTQSYDLLQNIVYSGMRKKAEEVLSSRKKLPRPKI